MGKCDAIGRGLHLQWSVDAHLRPDHPIEATAVIRDLFDQINQSLYVRRGVDKFLSGPLAIASTRVRRVRAEDYFRVAIRLTPRVAARSKLNSFAAHFSKSLVQIPEYCAQAVHPHRCRPRGT